LGERRYKFREKHDGEKSLTSVVLLNPAWKRGGEILKREDNYARQSFVMELEWPSFLSQNNEEKEAPESQEKKKESSSALFLLEWTTFGKKGRGE